MGGKTIVITGGTDGVGLAAARALAQQGHRVILVGRSVDRGRQALALLPPAIGRAHRFIGADLSLMSNIASLVAELAASEPVIDVLANNAGALFHDRTLTAEGNERMVAINHLAYVAMAQRLKPLLAAAPDGRIINTGSFVYTRGRYDPDNFQSEQRFSPHRTYAATKLYNLMATRALAQRWAETGITVNCFNPGFVATGFGRGENGWFGPIDRMARRMVAVTPQKAASTLVYLAQSPEASPITGAYFDRCRVTPVKGVAIDTALDDQLLDHSLRLVGG